MERREFLKLTKLGLLMGAAMPLAGAGFMSQNGHVKDFLLIKRDTFDLLDSVPNLNQDRKQDIILIGKEYENLKKLFNRLVQIQNIAGYGHFNVISFDEALKLARNNSKIGSFTKEDLELSEKLFNEKGDTFGFYGEKVVSELTADVTKNETKKIPYTGHFLYKGKAEEMYKKIQKDMGEGVILTSGVRGVVKQMYLFINKTIKLEGNLSVASRSLAPPGYSFHSVGDFDVGKVGFGAKNFSSEFANTDEFKRLMDLGYIKIRYPEGNPYGVRFEPWHIKVV
ncbi:MAG: hypothetical protein QG567_1873 [Campylobacterota bacterium]|nr:hypothetical protein [Campylobacterota bacterium]